MLEQSKVLNENFVNENLQELLTVQNTNGNKAFFTQRQLDNLSLLGDTLRRIVKRQLADNVIEIVNGKIIEKIKP